MKLLMIGLVLVAATYPLKGHTQEILPQPNAPTAADLEGRRVILVTGSTGGLGREVALELGGDDAHIIVHGRDQERGLEVVEALRARGATASLYLADFSAMEEVRRLGEAIARDYDRVDVLVNNAGIWLSGDDERYLSPDGYELSFAVNYLSGFLLTGMLLPLIPDGPQSRIVNVASGAQNVIDFDDVMLEEGYSGGRSYGQSKLAQILFTVDLANELEGRGIIVSALHPATLMDTDMVIEAGVQPRSSVEEGREAVVNLIRSDDIVSGQYYNGLRPATANDQAYDADARRRLRELSEALVGL